MTNEEELKPPASLSPEKPEPTDVNASRIISRAELLAAQVPADPGRREPKGPFTQAFEQYSDGQPASPQNPPLDEGDVNASRIVRRSDLSAPSPIHEVPQLSPFDQPGVNATELVPRESSPASGFSPATAPDPPAIKPVPHHCPLCGADLRPKAEDTKVSHEPAPGVTIATVLLLIVGLALLLHIEALAVFLAMR